VVLNSRHNLNFLRTLGLCLLPLVGYLSGDWQVISLVTVLPMVSVFLGWKFVPESPRWQLTRGHRDKGSICRISRFAENFLDNH
jgi:hypothetical protein